MIVAYTLLDMPLKKLDSLVNQRLKGKQPDDDKLRPIQKSRITQNLSNSSVSKSPSLSSRVTATKAKVDTPKRVDSGVSRSQLVKEYIPLRQNPKTLASKPQGQSYSKLPSRPLTRVSSKDISAKIDTGLSSPNPKDPSPLSFRSTLSPHYTRALFQ